MVLIKALTLSIRNRPEPTPLEKKKSPNLKSKITKQTIKQQKKKPQPSPVPPLWDLPPVQSLTLTVNRSLGYTRARTHTHLHTLICKYTRTNIQRPKNITNIHLGLLQRCREAAEPPEAEGKHRRELAQPQLKSPASAYNLPRGLC